jgi:hypothetical protein
MKLKLLSQNAKIKKSEFKTYNFGIPAYKSQSGLITCPGAKDCVKGCYARQGFYHMPTVSNAYERRLAATLRDDFPEVMIEELIESCAERVRIHDSGDFYSKEYLHKWLKIIDSMPHVEFYCYTKSIQFFSMLRAIPDNFKVCFSYGGHGDVSINPEKDRHSKVFSTLEELLEAGYADASENDDVCLGDNHRIGLIYHGHKSKQITLGV